MHILLKNNYIMKTLKYYEIYVFIWAICGSLTLDEYYIFIIFISKYLLYICYECDSTLYVIAQSLCIVTI